MTALIISVFNRPEYLKRCLESLSEAKFPHDIVLIMINDASTDQKTLQLFKDFELENISIVKFNNSVNQGIKRNIKFGVEKAILFGCSEFIILDSDCVVKRDFVFQLQYEFNRLAGRHPITGFNSVIKNRDGSERHPIIGSDDNGFLKSSVGGANLMMNKQMFTDYFLPTMNSNDNWDKVFCQYAKQIYCISPSIVQHIGFDSSMKHIDEPDYAQDFANLSLPDVTLIGVDTNHFHLLEAAARISKTDIVFADTKLLQPFEIKNANDYNYFIVKKLNDHFQTSHCLIIQHDGYVLNYKAWADEFLQYDYIGATWLYKDNMNVGNGGFSLRSKKLMEILQNDETIIHTMPEDYNICRTYRSYLEKKYGIKFAPEEVANRFSIEAYGNNVLPGSNKYAGQFGFHGFNIDYTESGLVHIPTKAARVQPVQNDKPWRNRSHII